MTGSDGLKPPVEFQLRDGTSILSRQVKPEDKILLRVGLEHLSPRSRHFRFFSGMKELSNQMVTRLTEIDHQDHDAWGALDMSGADGVPTGIARYIRLPDEATVAEAAVTVVDAYQGRGLGSYLLGLIACRALENGIDTFSARVLTDNEKMLRVFSELGATKSMSDPGEVEIRFPLYRDGEGYPDTFVGRTFKKCVQEIYPWSA